MDCAFPGRGQGYPLSLLRVEEKNTHSSFQSPVAATTQAICTAHKPAKKATDTLDRCIEHHEEA